MKSLGRTELIRKSSSLRKRIQKVSIQIRGFCILFTVNATTGIILCWDNVHCFDDFFVNFCLWFVGTRT